MADFADERRGVQPFGGGRILRQAVPAPLRFFPLEAPESPEAPKASIAGSKATKPAPEFEGEGEAQGADVVGLLGPKRFSKYLGVVSL